MQFALRGVHSINEACRRLTRRRLSWTSTMRYRDEIDRNDKEGLTRLHHEHIRNIIILVPEYSNLQDFECTWKM